MIVYLDSQDYSHLASPPAGKAAIFAALKQELQELVDSGAIEVR